MTNNNSADV